jgi:hypothetical protein
MSRVPTIYTVSGGPLPDEYDVECNWCRFGRVTPANRCWIPVPKKNVVHQTCATGAREKDREGLFCQWPCALAFCYHRAGMRRYMDQVRIAAGKHGYIGILPMAPDPIKTLKQCLPSIPLTIKESQAQYTKYIKDNTQVLALRDSEISSARVHRLYKNPAMREGIHVLEHSSVQDPDMREPTPSIETITEGSPNMRMGAYAQYQNAQKKVGKKKGRPSKDNSSTASSSSNKPSLNSAGVPKTKSKPRAKSVRPMSFKPLF